MNKIEKLLVPTDFSPCLRETTLMRLFSRSS